MSDYVHQFIFIVIVIASVCVGIQTYDLDEQTEHVFFVLDTVILVIFTLEVILNLMAEGTRVWLFLRCLEMFRLYCGCAMFCSGIESQASVLRLLRLLRVLKLLRQFPELQIIIVSILNSFAS